MSAVLGRAILDRGAARQRGVVLFIALIVLVAMSLAAAALMRSVDTTGLVIGNLAFKQAAFNEADRAVREAVDALIGVHAPRPARGPAILDTTADDAAQNYSAAQLADNEKGVPLDLANAPRPAKPGECVTGGRVQRALCADDKTASTGMTVRWVVDRMCLQAGPVSDWNCPLSAASTVGTNSTKWKGVGMTSNTYFRVTVRVDGPKNAVSFTQVVLNNI